MSCRVITWHNTVVYNIHRWWKRFCYDSVKESSRNTALWCSALSNDVMIHCHVMSCVLTAPPRPRPSPAFMHFPHLNCNFLSHTFKSLSKHDLTLQAQSRLWTFNYVLVVPDSSQYPWPPCGLGYVNVNEAKHAAPRLIKGFHCNILLK